MISIPKNILEKPIVKNILDQSKSVYRATNITLENIKLNNELERNNPLDMVTLLNYLQSKQAVVVIPEYESLSGGYKKEGEILTSTNGRHGKIIGLVGNNKNFSFSMKIIDANIIKENEIGSPRAFRITDPEGNKYKGMEKFQIVSKFDDFQNMQFGSFISPDRWPNLFSEDYFIIKLLMKRLTMESTYYFGQMKKMLAEGIEYPDKKESDSGEYYHAKGVKKIIKGFKIDVNVPGLHEVEVNFPEVESTQENLVNISATRSSIIYTIVPRLNFMARVIEFAYFKFNRDNVVPNEFKEVWGDVSWQPMKINKTDWDCLKLSNGLELRKREFEFTERVPE